MEAQGLICSRMQDGELIYYLKNDIWKSFSDDELVEITPKSIRLRKKILDNKERERAARAANKN